MAPTPFRSALLTGFALAASLPLLHAEPVDLKIPNPTFANVTEGVPADWRGYPGPNGEGTKIEALPDGGVKMTDTDSENGLGLAQFFPVVPGHQYQATLKTGGVGTLSLSIDMLPKIPPKMAMINKIKLAEERAGVKPEEDTVVKITAPEGATQAWLILYSPKASPSPCEVELKSIKLEDLTGGDAVATVPAPTLGAAAEAMKPRPAAETIPEGTIKVVDFETGDMSQPRLLEGGKPVIATAPEPVRSGKYSMKTALTHEDHRSEMTSFRAAPYGEAKYGWCIYIPKEFDAESWFSIVTQWHSWGTGRDYVMDKPGPPTCITIAKSAWQLKLYHQGDDPASNKAITQFFPFGSIEGDRGKWTEFVMEVNWQSPTTGGGYLRLYKNGELVVDYKGATWFDGKTAGPFFKMGVYKGSGTWKGEEPGAVLYFDDFKMVGAGGKREDVDPAVKK